MIADDIRLSLEILGFDQDPAELSDLIGLAPASTWKKGQTVFVGPKDSKKAHVRKHENGWQLDSRRPSSCSLTEHVDDILDQVQDHTDQIARVTSQYPSRLRATLLLHDSRPDISLSSKQLSGIAKLNVELYLDFYFLNDDIPDRAR